MAHGDHILIGPFKSSYDGSTELFHHKLMFVSAHIVNKSDGRVVANFESKTELVKVTIPSDCWLYFVGE